MRWFLATVAAALCALRLGMVLADGVGESNYNYVNPPQYLRSSNATPSSATGTIPFVHGASSIGNVSTADTQAGINFDPGAFPPSPGQSAVRVSVIPLTHYPRLPAKSILNGNVYGFRAVYLPSGRPIIRLSARALVTLVYPRTPTGILGVQGTQWRQLCNWKAVIQTASTVSCYERDLAPEIVLLRGSHAPAPGFDSYFILALGIIVFGATALIIPYVIYKNFVRKPAARRP